MSFQIQAIHIYSNTGERRTVRLRTGAVNIITGRSATGKSSILDIISYCLGSDNYHVAAGVIRDAVQHYALELYSARSVILVSRPAPSPGRSTSTQMHISLHAHGSVVDPDLSVLIPNHDIRSALATLGELLGIPNITTDVGLGTRREFSITPKHALFFCLQSQAEVANPNALFHGQSKEWAPQAIRDVLPFFLGVVDPLFVAKRALLQQKERTLRSRERRRSEELAIRGPSGRALSLIREAIDAGLLGQFEGRQVPTGNEVPLLFQALNSETAPDEWSGPGTDGLSALERERSELRQELASLRATRGNLRQLARNQSDFAGEAGAQKERLQSLGMLRLSEEHEDSGCPLCGQDLDRSDSTVAAVKLHLDEVSRQIKEVVAGVPKVQALLAETENRFTALNERLAENKASIDGWLAARELFESLQERSLRQAAVRGRIALYLESVNPAVERSFTAGDIESLESEIVALRAELDLDAARSRMDGILSRLSHVMTDVASRLELEHSPAPVRLDVGELTVVVDTPTASYKLSEIGSAENWLGYHLAALLALHSRFVESASPVPRFLVLDQPSQVYFPPDATGDDVDLGDDDRAALRRFYGELRLFVEAQDGEFQILVMDHADESDAWFRASVVERWRGGSALVPVHWSASG